MERHQNQNAFTWKRMKLTVCIIAQYKSVTIMDFRVREAAENMLTPSTVGSFTSTKNPIRKKSLEGTTEDQTSKTTKHAVKLLPSFSLSCDIGEVFTKWLTGSGGGCKKYRAAQQIATRCLSLILL